ncbi:MAG: translocation/assembly module TamB domain-containing protein, partial [Blastocatellia bacterium]
MPSENKSTPPRANWPKRFLIVAACLLLIAGIVAIGAWFYLRSERFNRFVADQIKAKLPEYGLRGEIGDFGITLDENRARLKDLKIYNQQTGQLVATLKGADISVRIPDLYALKLSREVEIEKIALDGLDLYVEIDEKGRTNFEGLRIPPPISKAITFDTRRLLTSVSNGAIHFKDRLHRIEADLAGLKADAQPASENPEIIKLLSSATAGRFSYEGREVKLTALDLAARVSAKGAEVESLALESGLGEVKARGKLDDWSALNHAFDVESKIKLEEAVRLLAANVAIKGTAAANARIEGRPADEKITGSLRSDEMEVAGTKLRGLQIAGIEVDAKSGLIQFSGDRATAQSAAVEKVRLGQIAVSNLTGNHKNGRTKLTAPAASVAGVEAPDTRIGAVRLRDLSVDVADGGRYEVAADVVAENARIGDLKVSSVTAKALADNDDLVVNDIKGKLFGGDFEADYEMQMARGARSKLKGNFSGIDTKDAATLLKTQNLPVAGKMSGTVDISFAGSNPRSLNGEMAARFEGTASDAADAIPLTGDVLVRADGGVFNFERAELATDVSRLTASGNLSYDGQSDLRLSLRSSQAEQLVVLARSLEAARPFIEEYEPQLIGEFKLDGRITGKLENPTIEGDASAATAGLRDAILGALTGHVVVSPTEVRVEKGIVTAPNGGTMKFDLASPLDKTAKSGTLSAVLDRIDLETILAAVGAPNAEQFISGDVSGEAHLTGLPADLEGSAQINLIEGKIADQPAEKAVAEVRFDGRDAFLERLEIKLPRSRLTATGSMNLDDYAFKLEGKADQIALDSLAQSLELQNTKIEGSADATFDVSGKVLVAGKRADLDWESLKVQLNAQGRNVRINGRDTGELKLTAETTPGGRLNAELTTGILAAQAAAGQAGKPETIKANIELRKPGRPVVIESELANLDVAPLLSIFASELVSTVTGSITGRLRIEGLTVDANGNATLDLLGGGLTLGGTDLQVAGNPTKIETPVSITLENSLINAAAINVSGPGMDLKFSGTVGLKDASPINFTLGGTVNLDRMPSISDDVFLSGMMTIDARAAGTVSEPRLAGKVDIAGFSLSSSNRPVFISNGAGAITLSGDQLSLDKFTADANDGTVEASGVTKLVRFRPAEWKYTIAVNNAQLIEQEINTTLTGTLTLTGTPEGQLLAGTVVIPQAEYQPDIDFDNIAVGGGGGLALGAFNTGPGFALPAGVPPINLNVRVEARDSIIIRNKQINTVGTGSLELLGKLSDPDVNGRITLDGGTLRFRGQRYEISNGSLDLPLGSATPILNLLAEGEYSGYRVSIGLIGPIDDLDMALRSEPQLTRGEILSLIATGRTEASTLGAQDPLRTGVGTAASLLTTGLISRPAERLLGISRFQIDPVLGPNLNPAARLTIGQQLSRNVYLTYSTNLAQEQFQTALAEYTISNRFSALASYTQGGNAARQGQREGVVTIELRGRQRFSLGFEPGLTGPAGDPNDALVRIAGPKLPLAQVSVNPVPDLKIKQDKLRELLPVMTQGFSRLLARLGEQRLREYLQEQGYFFAEVKSRCEPVSCAGENLKV